MKIYIICDLEGTAGVVDHKSQCCFAGEFYQEAREQATKELNALVEGLLESGATEIVAWDGHGNFPGGINPFCVHQKCKIITGAGDGGPVLLDNSFDAVFLLGLHAMAGAKKAVLAHSFMPFYDEVVINHLKIGEIGMNCITASQYDVPVVFISGDNAGIEEAKALVPNIECAVVKYGLSEEALELSRQSPALSLSSSEACRLIKNKAVEAMKRVKDIKPLKVSAPYELLVKYKEKQYADNLMNNHPNAKRIDAVTVQMKEDNFFKLQI
ncbi:MAG TPA: M55 family metallopeptidase [Bacillota bacterium]|nr:M55 family metallopeptidase [Bacillota bacterium]